MRQAYDYWQDQPDSFHDTRKRAPRARRFLAFFQLREPGDNAPMRADPSNPSLFSLPRNSPSHAQAWCGDETSRFPNADPCSSGERGLCETSRATVQRERFRTLIPSTMATRYGHTHRALKLLFRPFNPCRGAMHTARQLSADGFRLRLASPLFHCEVAPHK